MPVKRFHFRLERLLEIRAFRERQWLARLAEASGHFARVGREIHSNAAARRGAFDVEARRGSELDLAMLTYRERYLSRLTEENRRLREELEQRRRRREEVQKKYLEVSRDRKILDKLKERKAAEYYAHGRREEFKAQDDLNCDRYIRGKELSR